MKKVFFLSHCTKDKKVVEKIAKSLGKEKCWLYEWEVKPGESIFKFDRGIADSRIFVLFWSKNAASSQWVEEETSQARIRLSRDKGFRLVVVRLDDTRLPYSLAYRSYIDGTKEINYIVKNLQFVEKGLTPEEVFVGKPILKDSFQNRERQLDRLEDVMSLEDYSGIMVLGLNGMGKTALVKRSIASLFYHLTPIWVDLRIAATPLRLLASIAKPLSIAVDPDYVAKDPVEMWHTKLLPEIAQSEKIFIVLDNMKMEIAVPTLQGRIVANLINTICKDLVQLNKPENPNVIIISWKAPNFNQMTLARYGRLQLGPLDEKSMIRALRFHLSRTSSMEYKSEKLEILARQLKGYPLAINLATMQVAEKGMDATIEDTSGIHIMLYNLAKEMFSRLSITPEEKKPLTLLATARCPLNADYLRSILGRDWAAIIGRIAQKQLLDPTSEGYSLHGILGDYVLESMARPEEIIECHRELGELFNSEWRKAPERSALSAKYGSLSYFHNLSAGEESTAKIIRFAYLEEAKEASIELYRRGQYKTVLAYLENVKKIDGQSDPIYDFYYALSLNRLQRSQEALPIMKELTERFPNVHIYHHGLGTILKWLNKYEKAADSFRKAIATSSRSAKSTSLCSLASVLCAQNKPEEALPLVKEALEISPGKSFAVATACDALEKLGDIPEALKTIMDALKISPMDARLNHRAGILLKKLGRFTEAKGHLEIATSAPGFPLSYTALADVYLRLGDINKAEETVEKFPGRKVDCVSYLCTKGNILRLKKEFEEAEKVLRRANKLDPEDPVSYGGLAQLKIDQAQQAVSVGKKQATLIFIEEAKTFLRKGLNIENNNSVLLSIRHAVDEFERKIGQK